MKKIITVTLLFIIAIVVLSYLFIHSVRSLSSENSRRNWIVSLNEIEQLISSENNVNQVNVKIQELQEDILNASQDSFEDTSVYTILFFAGTCILYILLVFGYLYYNIIKPFQKMEKYAAGIAKGNFEDSLYYERSNCFGAFTWAFDHMRRVIIKARECEKEAIENNKTVIATLSHDIKTPIASIRAYAEGLESSIYQDEESKNRYLSVILRKCDEVTKLTNDMFMHSLSDLDKLQMNYENINIKEFLEDFMKDIQYASTYIIVKGTIPQITLSIDRKRIGQVLENIITNSNKYGTPPIEISCRLLKDKVEIVIVDYGPGIKDEDMPFILQKFYRGSNVRNKDGAGLGLYIVNYVMKQHKGQVFLKNRTTGLEVILTLPYS